MRQDIREHHSLAPTLRSVATLCLARVLASKLNYNCERE